jgi:acetyltransferase-like isoleucine patch superfamily enzyme
MNIAKHFKKIFRRLRGKKAKGLHEKYPQYAIGRGTYGDPDIIWQNDQATLRIGAFCSIAEGVTIFMGGEHRVDWVTTYPFNYLWKCGMHITGHPKTKGDVIIGNDVWIGLDAVIMSGVTVGDGAVIGARAVITKDVEPYAIYAGNPARLIRKRFDEPTIQQLLELEWWNCKDEEIERLIPLMLSGDVHTFIVEAGKIKSSG